MSKVIVDEIQTDTTDGNVRIIPNGTGKLEIKGAGGDDAMIRLNCSAQTHGVKIKSPNHNAGQSYTMILPDNNIEAGKFLKVKSVTGTPANEAVGQLEYADAGGGVTSDAQFNTVGGTNAGNSFSGTNANKNTLFGYDAGAALGAASGQDRSVLIGYNAGKVSTSEGLVGIGAQALEANTTGWNNTAVGYSAGWQVTTGKRNLFLGANTGTSLSPSGTVTTADGIVCLGDNNVTNLYCADTSISSSDQRDKTDVTDFTKGLEWIEALRPVTYRWDRRTWYGTDEEPYGTPDGSKKRSQLHIGFLAQEALAVEQSNGYGADNDNSLSVHLNEDGMSYGMKYERLVPILVNAIKELSARVKTLEGG